jgi:adenylyltransferase/sulfurtransferase
MALFDGLPMTWREIKIRRDPECTMCGPNRTITKLIDYVAFCGGPAPTVEVPTMTPQQFHSRVSRGEKFTLIDVREPHEWEIVNLAEHGATLIPLGMLPSVVQTLDLNAPIVVHCRSGARSAKAVRALMDAGASHIWNMEGGILAWSARVDPTKPRY